jgi:hypothetical protein
MILERLWGLLPCSDQTNAKLVCKSWRKLAEHFEDLARRNSENSGYLGNESGHEEEEGKKISETFELEDSHSFIEVSSEGEVEEGKEASGPSSEEVKRETEKDGGIEEEGIKGDDFSLKEKHLFTNWLYGATAVLNSGGSATDSSAISAR